jgi:hypothetical protein
MFNCVHVKPQVQCFVEHLLNKQLELLDEMR